MMYELRVVLEWLGRKLVTVDAAWDVHISKIRDIELDNIG